MATYSNSAREVEMPNGDVVVLHNGVTANTTSNIKKFKYDDNGHVTESTDANATDLNLNSYSTPTTGSTAIGTSDAVQTAIGKLDHQSQIDQSNILYAINTGVANIVPPQPDNLTSENATAICDGKGKVNLSGTTSTSLVTFDYNDLNFATLGVYHLTGCPANGSASTYELSMQQLTYTEGSTIPAVTVLAHDYGTGADFEINSLSSDSVKYRLRIVVRSNVTLPSAPFYPMVSFVEYNSFKPYALPNYDLTRLEAEDRASLAEVVDSGAKNKLQYDLTSLKAGNTDGTWNNNVYTVLGISFTVNSDLTISVSGTRTSTTGNAILNLSSYTAASNDILSQGVTYSNCYLYARGGSTTCNTASSTVILPNDIGVSRTYAISVPSAVTGAVNVKISPMICTKAAFGVSNKFVPYRPSWDVIADSIKTVQIATSDFITVNTNFTILSQSTLFKHGSQVFGTLVIQKTDTAKFVDSLAAVGTIKSGYRPIVNLIGQSYYNTEQWGVNGFGYSYINTSGTVSVKSSTDSANKYSYVAIPINYMTA